MIESGCALTSLWNLPLPPRTLFFSSPFPDSQTLLTTHTAESCLKKKKSLWPSRFCCFSFSPIFERAVYTSYFCPFICHSLGCAVTSGFHFNSPVQAFTAWELLSLKWLMSPCRPDQVRVLPFNLSLFRAAASQALVLSPLYPGTLLFLLVPCHWQPSLPFSLALISLLVS